VLHVFRNRLLLEEAADRFGRLRPNRTSELRPLILIFLEAFGRNAAVREAIYIYSDQLKVETLWLVIT
jgi:hypothetical protein